MNKIKILNSALVILWLVWIIISLFLTRWLIDTFIFSFLSFIPFEVAGKVLVFYFISIPLTTLVACKGSLKTFKKKFKNIIILNFLVAFIFYAFYQFNFAYLGGSNLSYETTYGFGEMTAFEYNIYYAETVKAFYIVALIKTLLIGLILSAAFFIINMLIQNGRD